MSKFRIPSFLIKSFLIPVIIVVYACSSSENEESLPDNSGGDTESPTTPEEEQNMPPNAFNLIEVANDSESVELSPNFEWEFATDPENEAITYSFFLDTSENPTTQLATNLSDTSYNLEAELELGTTYYWQVEASDASGNTTISAIFSFTTKPIGSFVAQPDFGFRHHAAVTELNGRLYMLGGFGTVNGAPQHYLDDVWSSDDGEVWTLEADNPGFIARALHPLVAFNDKMFLIGGFRANGPSNDIWSSTDGKNWVMETANAEFPEDWGHKMLHFNDKLWLITGGSNNESNRSVWNSENGVNWTRVVEDIGFSLNLDLEAVVFNNRMWVIVNDEIHSSDNGIDWTLELEDAPFADLGTSGFSLKEYSLVVHNGKMVLMVSRQDTSESADIWSSSNGKDWILEHTQTAFPNREDNSFISFGGKIYIMLGFNDQGFLGDIWTLD
ncbi:hypothetical protein GTQ34_10400 [Muricauda sp. JGD-17]|uniref:DUF6242 domain-containing protein n=1 Tax=Flagellimonas ochracea TaxID=2696472 RepID=A0A964TCJ3_9FLAO|nr:hypothetical protein [Allomuricauda ochracea]NAY92330.1 hypothetical protein [Allomuricauda ochracea]